MERALQNILFDIQRKIDKSGIKENYIEKAKVNIKHLIESYDKVQIPEGYMDVYDSLIKKGRELQKESNLRDQKKMEYYLNYCEAALYDFNGNLKPLKNILGLFMITSILLLVLGPQLLGPAIMVFIVPIYLGIRGLKKRSRTGLNMALSVIPVAALTSVTWMRMAVMSSKNFSDYVTKQASMYNLNETTARMMLISFMILGFILLITSLYTIYLSVKHRKMFI